MLCPVLLNQLSWESPAHLDLKWDYSVCLHFPMDGIAMSIGPSFLPPPPPPPPAPAPPQPPPPPPPPPITGCEPFSRSVHRRSKMRNFNWDTIPKHSVVGKRNVWTSQKKLEDIPLDTKRMEELFSHSERQQMPPRHGTVKKSVWGLHSTSSSSENVSTVCCPSHFRQVEGVSQLESAEGKQLYGYSGVMF